jgi:hypothetical protein
MRLKLLAQHAGLLSDAALQHPELACERSVEVPQGGNLRVGAIAYAGQGIDLALSVADLLARPKPDAPQLGQRVLEDVAVCRRCDPP